MGNKQNKEIPSSDQGQALASTSSPTSTAGDGDSGKSFTELQLWHVSEKVMPGLQDKLGDILGLTQAEIDAIRLSADLSCSREATLKILLLWHERQKKGNKVETLTQVLKNLDLWEKGLFSYVSAANPKAGKKATSTQVLTDIQLRCVANRFPDEQYVLLGLQLGIRYQDIAEMWIASHHHVKEAAFLLLTTWRRDFTAQAHARTLANVLEAVHQVRLADEVRQGIALKVHHYEGRYVNMKADGLNTYLGLDDKGSLAFLEESEDKIDRDRYVVELHIFNTSKTDHISEGSPCLVCLSSNWLTVDSKGNLSLLREKKSTIKVKEICKADDRFFFYDTSDDGLSTLKSLKTAKFLYVDPSTNQPGLTDSKENAVRFKEILGKRPR